MSASPVSTTVFFVVSVFLWLLLRHLLIEIKGGGAAGARDDAKNLCSATDNRQIGGQSGCISGRKGR